MNISDRTLHLVPREAYAYGITSPPVDTPVALKDIDLNAPWCPWRRWEELTEIIRADEDAALKYDAWPKGLLALMGGPDADSQALDRHVRQRDLVAEIAGAVMVYEIEAGLGIPHK